ADLLAFTAIMAILVKGGMGLGKVFQMLGARPRPQLSLVLGRVERAIIQDREPLSRALANHPLWFNESYVATIEVGESGDLGKALDRLYRQIARDHLQRRQQRSPQQDSLSSACRHV